jgi:hypothetical protein
MGKHRFPKRNQVAPVIEVRRPEPWFGAGGGDG